jgi:riboflavin synthase
MFTGIIEALGKVHRIVPDGAGRLLSIEVPSIAFELRIGDSVAINGACLTVIAADASVCRFQAGPETLRRTNLGELSTGDRVNVERAIRLSDRLGGHIVQGHVDALGTISERIPQGDFELFWFTCPPELTSQMVSKGSVAVDGVSLTLVDVAADRFSVALIPHTLANTTLGFKRPGGTANLETDLLAKYVSKCLRGSGVSWDALRQAGFLGERDSRGAAET